MKLQNERLSPVFQKLFLYGSFFRQDLAKTMCKRSFQGSMKQPYTVTLPLKKNCIN